MSFLQHSMYLSRTSHTKARSFSTSLNGRKSLRSRLSLSSLAHLARNPVGVVGEVVEGWRDGLTPEERTEKQRVDNRKQILYCKLRNVSHKGMNFVRGSELTDGRQLTTQTGTRQRQNSTSSKVIMNGRRFLSRRTATRSSSSLDSSSLTKQESSAMLGKCYSSSGQP